MALGTITTPTTLGSRANYTDANKRVRVRDVQLTSGANYTAGGETVTPQQVGLNVIEECRVHGLALVSGAATSRSVGVVYNTDGSVKLSVQTTASAEAAANSDQSTYTVRITFVGR